MKTNILQKIINYYSSRANIIDKERVIDELQKHDIRNLLDTGCGTGEFTKILADRLGIKNAIGIEIEPWNINLATKRGIKIIKADLNKRIPLKSNSFDAIISIQNIEHLYFTDNYLEEMKRLLRPKGVFIITTTNLAAWHYRLMLLFGMLPICLHPSQYQVFPLNGKHSLYCHHSVFTHNALKEVVQKHGYIIEKHYSHTIYFLPYWLSKTICKIFPNWGTFSCFVLTKNQRQANIIHKR